MAGTYSGNYEVTSNATYGPATSTTLNGNLYVNSDATLKNLVVNGTVYVNPGQNGTVTLNNVAATNIVVLSGATNSIHLNNVTAGNLTVKNDNSVRIESNSGTAITNTIVQSGATLDANGGSFGTIELTPTSSAPIELRGNLAGSAITVTKSNVVLKVAAGATVGTLNIEAAATGTTVDNAGTINEVMANTDNVVIEGNQPETVTPGENVELAVSVGSETELKSALEKNYAVINLKNGFEVISPILVSKKVTINGEGNIITRSNSFKEIVQGNGLPKINSVIVVSQNGAIINNLVVDSNGKEETGWQGLYALQVYNAKDVQLNKVLLKNGDGGLIVNGSTVKATDISTSGNEYGGIEVSKGAEAGLSNSALTITGESSHEDAEGKPAIWVYPGQGTLSSDLYEVTATEQGNANNQTYYNLRTSLSVYDFEIGEFSSVVAGTPVEVPVTLKATAVNKLGYESVIAEVSTTKKPADSSVKFYALDSNNTPILQTDNGVWGPNAGFLLPKDHNATTPFNVTFSKSGNYTITVKLKDKVTNKYIAEKTVNVTAE
ncbi:hypothetical protein [Sporosarcina aquimarina]|uniref:hypothetical protein n=1 Tax=Sporosarcina aquimarina TaxID=114975 RepID=UPI00295EA0E6|nr:hypothetical protein [Sporosarcina aquimarina]